MQMQKPCSIRYCIQYMYKVQMCVYYCIFSEIDYCGNAGEQQSIGYDIISL